MEKTAVQRLARIFKILVIVTLMCNIVVLLMVPALVTLKMNWWELLQMAKDPHEPISPVLVVVFMWPEVLRHLYQGWSNPYVMLTLFLVFCGVCTAVILWQAKKVLDTILKGEPFTLGNAVNLKRAAVCCFLIAGAALTRLIWGLAYYRSIGPLLNYNALFIPVFFMAGLVFMVMSALFRQAAELKEDQDLTI